MKDCLWHGCFLIVVLEHSCIFLCCDYERILTIYFAFSRTKKNEVSIFEYVLSADIDECSDDLNPCHSQARCDNVLGSYDCTCNQGFRGNGKDCEGRRSKGARRRRQKVRRKFDSRRQKWINFRHISCETNAPCRFTDCVSFLQNKMGSWFYLCFRNNLRRATCTRKRHNFARADVVLCRNQCHILLPERVRFARGRN